MSTKVKKKDETWHHLLNPISDCWRQCSLTAESNIPHPCRDLRIPSWFLQKKTKISDFLSVSLKSVQWGLQCFPATWVPFSLIMDKPHISNTWASSWVPFWKQQELFSLLNLYRVRSWQFLCQTSQTPTLISFNKQWKWWAIPTAGVSVPCQHFDTSGRKVHSMKCFLPFYLFMALLKKSRFGNSLAE